VDQVFTVGNIIQRLAKYCSQLTNLHSACQADAVDDREDTRLEVASALSASSSGSLICEFSFWCAFSCMTLYHHSKVYTIAECRSLVPECWVCL
jgi:hypothetical protein